MSAFFSGSETGMMAINRYRLKHLVQEKNKSAKRVSKLLETKLTNVISGLKTLERGLRR